MSGDIKIITETIKTLSESIFQFHGRHGLETAFAFTEDIILTSAHSLDSEKRPFTDLEGKELETEFIGSDPRLDLAVFRATQGGLKPLSHAEKIQVGQEVLTLGANRFGSGPRITKGLISALGDEWLTRKGGQIHQRIEVDATLPWGSSGGPLINLDGRLHGMNTHALLRGGTTIPTDTLEETVERIQDNGSISQGWLGVKVHATPLPADLAESEDQKEGMLIVWRSWIGAAKKSGLKVGDILLSANDQKLGNYRGFRSLFSAAGGKSVDIRFIRAGEIHDKTIKVNAEKTCGRKRSRCPP
jgi:serine protease Do